ncbi:MAG: taurine dioxygenase [Acidimicrobiales bacterium]|nr:MAG: taurine dioxygenase [Acidimicrobiales bacterium]
MVNFEAQPVSPVFGAEITGMDLAVGIDDATFEALEEAFHAHGVLFFRGQSLLSADAQVGLARRLGPLHQHPAAPMDDADSAVFVIHAHRDSPVANGNGWHTDVSCDEEPPLATMLQIHQLPQGGGGDTLFADMEAAYRALPPEWRSQLKSLTARHESEHVYRGRYADRGVDDTDAIYPAAEHPVVRTHPDTGRPSIYVNRSFTTAIVGMEPDQSDELLNWLFNHVERPEFQIRFTWQQNDVALWDNRRLQHFAIWDYWPDERKGHRVSGRGTKPFFDPDAPEPPEPTIRLSIGALAARPGGS